MIIQKGVHDKIKVVQIFKIFIIVSERLFDGCYSSKFLRSSARRFLLEILVRGTRYEVARAGLVH